MERAIVVGGVAASARYWAVVHDGKGNVLRRTHPGPNKLTKKLFNDLLSGAAASGAPVVGAGNTPATESDVTLQTYLGKANSVEVVAGSYQYTNTPDVDGYLWMKQTYVAHYLPTRLGTSAVNVSEAGFSSNSITSTTGTTPLYSRGLLVDGVGAPTSISYDAKNEYLDVYWELTWWVPAEISGTVTLDILGANIVHDYVVRPSNWRQLASSSNYNWIMPGADTTGVQFPKLGMSVSPGTISPGGTSETRAASGPLGTFTQYPTATGGVFPVSNSVIQPFTTDKQRDWELQFAPASGNVPGGIGALHVGSRTGGNHTGSSWQISLSPKIDKTATRNFNFTIRCAAGNK